MGEASQNSQVTGNAVGFDAGQGSRWPTRTIEFFLLLFFLVLGLVGLWHHELWRDETQAWLIARDSATPLDLYRHAEYEGHPLLWHYCLYAITRFTHSLRAMQGFSLLLGLGSATLIVKKSPFSLLQKGLIVFGYFSVYEYTLLSRSYGLGVFLVFLFCALYCQKRPIFWALTLVLALLANTSVFGLILSVAFAIALYHRLVLSPGVPWGRHVLALVFSWCLCVVQMVRPFSSHVNLSHDLAECGGSSGDALMASQLINQLHDISKLLQIVLKSYWPLPAFHFHFWNGHLLGRPFEVALEGPSNVGIAGLTVVLVISAALVGLTVWVVLQLLKKNTLFLSVYVFGNVSMMALFVFVYLGSTRHYGHLFILLLACLWLLQWSSRYLPNRQNGAGTLANRLFTGMLCLQVFAGGYAYYSDVVYPFSSGAQAAQVLRAQQFTALPILGIHQRPVSPISAYLDEPMYYPESEQLGSFWDISYCNMTEVGSVLAALDDFSQRYPAFVAVLNESIALEELEEDVDGHWMIDKIAHVGPSIVEDEAFYLYKISSQ